MSKFSRWPLGLLSFALISVAVGLDLTTETTAAFAGAIEVLGIVTGGAFIYAEGAHHREWWTQYNKKNEQDTEPEETP